MRKNKNLQNSQIDFNLSIWLKSGDVHGCLKVSVKYHFHLLQIFLNFPPNRTIVNVLPFLDRFGFPLVLAFHIYPLIFEFLLVMKNGQELDVWGECYFPIRYTLDGVELP